MSFALLLFLCSIYFYFKHKKFKENAIYTRGQIVDVVEKIIDSFGEKTTFFFPIISFTDNKGEKKKVESTVGEGLKSQVKIGDFVEVAYNRYNTDELIIKSNMKPWISIICGFISIIFLLIGIL